MKAKPPETRARRKVRADEGKSAPLVAENHHAAPVLCFTTSSTASRSMFLMSSSERVHLGVELETNYAAVTQIDQAGPHLYSHAPRDRQP